MQVYSVYIYVYFAVYVFMFACTVCRRIITLEKNYDKVILIIIIIAVFIEHALQKYCKMHFKKNNR